MDRPNQPWYKVVKRLIGNLYISFVIKVLLKNKSIVANVKFGKMTIHGKNILIYVVSAMRIHKRFQEFIYIQSNKEKICEQKTKKFH